MQKIILLIISSLFMMSACFVRDKTSVKTSVETYDTIRISIGGEELEIWKHSLNDSLAKRLKKGNIDPYIESENLEYFIYDSGVLNDYTYKLIKCVESYPTYYSMLLLLVSKDEKNIIDVIKVANGFWEEGVLIDSKSILLKGKDKSLCYTKEYIDRIDYVELDTVFVREIKQDGFHLLEIDSLEHQEIKELFNSQF